MALKAGDVLKQLKKAELVYLATVDQDHPCLRPMNLVVHEERFFLLTFTSSKKVGMIKANPKIELCTVVDKWNRNYIRASGTAGFIDDADLREEVASKAGFFKFLWKDSVNPEFTLMEVTISRLEYLEADVRVALSFDLG